MSVAPERPGDRRVAVLASRVGADEKRLFDAFDRRGVPFNHVDTRRQWFLAGQRGLPWGLALNREIGQVRSARQDPPCLRRPPPDLRSSPVPMM